MRGYGALQYCFIMGSSKYSLSERKLSILCRDPDVRPLDFANRDIVM